MDNTYSNRYIPGFDGLRALAIFFIAAYHFSFSWADGGFLGVDIFFVISGYLITSRILLSQEDELDFDFRKFWSRRIQRLLPAFYVMIMTAVIWVVLFNRELLTIIWGDAVSSAFYTTNWWFIFHKLSYFDNFGAPSPFKHLWYLAVQEQFFIVWSIVLIKWPGYFKKRKKFSITIFISSLCSALLMGILYNPEVDPSRIYYGTDTRSFELLIGSVLAIVLPIKKLQSKEISLKQKIALNIAGIISLAVIIGSAVFVNEYQAFLYRGGLFLFDLNTCLLIACLCIPGCIICKLLSWKPLRWIGTRSYGIYLWHYPIMVLSTPVYDLGYPVYWRIGLQIAITCIIAEFSYRFIEKPIRQLGMQEFFRKYLSFDSFSWGKSTMAKKITAAAGFIILLAAVSSTGIINNQNKAQETASFPNEEVVSSAEQVVSDNDSIIVSPENDAANLDARDEAGSAENNALSIHENGEESPDGSNILGSDKKDGANSNESNTENPDEKSKDDSPAENKLYKEILTIGDSIMLDIAPYLKKKYSNITIDGKVSRQLADAVKLAPSYAKFNDAEKAVVIELGTNGYFTDKQIDSLLDSFSKAHVYLVNTRVPRRWEKTVNEMLKEKAEDRDNVTLIDWYSIAVEHPEYFGRDAVHLKASGSEALTNLISEALNS